MYRIDVIRGEERKKITCPVCENPLGSLNSFRAHFRRKHHDDHGKLKVIKVSPKQREFQELTHQNKTEMPVERSPQSEIMSDNPVLDNLLMQINEQVLRKIRQTPDLDFDILHGIQIAMGGPEKHTRRRAKDIYNQIKGKINGVEFTTVNLHQFKGQRGSKSPVCDFKTLLKIFAHLPGKAGRKIRDECLELTTRAMAGDYDLESALRTRRLQISAESQEKLMKNISSSAQAQVQRQEQETLETGSTVLEYSSHDLQLTVQGMYSQEQPSSMMVQMMWQKANSDIEEFISIFSRLLEPKYKYVTFINDEKRKEAEEHRKEAEEKRKNAEEDRKDERLEVLKQKGAADIEVLKQKGVADIEVLKQKGSAEVEILKSKAKTEAEQAAQLHRERIQTERKRREALVKAETSLVTTRGTKRKFRQAPLIFPQNQSSVETAISPAPSRDKMQIIQNILKKSKAKLDKKEARKKRKLAKKTSKATVLSITVDVPSVSRDNI